MFDCGSNINCTCIKWLSVSLSKHGLVSHGHLATIKHDSNIFDHFLNVVFSQGQFCLENRDELLGADGESGGIHSVHSITPLDCTIYQFIFGCGLLYLITLLYVCCKDM